MRKEQSRRIVFLFHRRQPRVIASPVRLLPVLLEKIALRNVGSALRHDRAQLIYALVDLLPGFSSGLNVRLMAAHPGISAACVAYDGQRKRIQHRGVRRGIARRLDRLARPSRQPFVEMQLDVLWREPANNACASRSCESSSSKDAGIHNDSYPYRNHAIAPSPSTTHCWNSLPALVRIKNCLMVLLPPLHVPPIRAGMLPRIGCPSIV